ncbi:hypothetical protein WICPIJ_001274 [Wickerhamomyces pijperi]|uniref:Uncharacterized protein n=1 Tax=Wickerhamomyces pijperi TaxID=599730 RepID=A0A9P8QE14_WICPI|nr:hypothetical protein WICPIJ_001274 [Wickerhamomyces pijperi]
MVSGTKFLRLGDTTFSDIRLEVWLLSFDFSLDGFHFLLFFTPNIVNLLALHQTVLIVDGLDGGLVCDSTSDLHQSVDILLLDTIDLVIKLLVFVGETWGFGSSTQDFSGLQDLVRGDRLLEQSGITIGINGE